MTTIFIIISRNILHIIISRTILYTDWSRWIFYEIVLFFFLDFLKRKTRFCIKFIQVRLFFWLLSIESDPGRRLLWRSSNVTKREKSGAGHSLLLMVVRSLQSCFLSIIARTCCNNRSSPISSLRSLNSLELRESAEIMSFLTVSAAASSVPLAFVLPRPISIRHGARKRRMIFEIDRILFLSLGNRFPKTSDVVAFLWRMTSWLLAPVQPR